MSKKISRKKALLRGSLLTSALVGLGTVRAYADTYYYQVPGNGVLWDATGQPYFAWDDYSASTNAQLPADSASTTANILGRQSGSSVPGISNSNITFNMKYTTGIATLNIGGGNTLTQSSSTSVMLSGAEMLGDYSFGGNNTGTYSQSGGSNTVTGTLALGLYSDGFYNLSGTGSLTTGAIAVGAAESSNSAFTQSGGTLKDNGNLTIGQEEAGTFTQSAGTATVTGTIGLTGSFPSTMNLSGTGTLNAGTIVDNSGTIMHTGGVLTVTNDLDIGGSNTAICNFNTGAVAQIKGNAYVGGNSSGPNGDGTLNAQGGSLTVNGTLKIYNTESTVALSAGTLTVGKLDTSTTPSSFNWTGGTLHITNQFLDFISSFTDPFSSNPLGSAPLTLSTGKNLSVDQVEILADKNDLITQNGTSTNTTFELIVGSAIVAGSNQATYTLNSGTLTTSMAYVGAIVGTSSGNIGGPGIFNQNGGVYNSNGPLTIGINTAGTFTQAGGTLTATSTANYGTFTQTGSAATCNATLGPVTGTGTLNISGTHANPYDLTYAQGLQQNSVNITNIGTLILTGDNGNAVNTLTISGNGQLDIRNFHLLINYGTGTDPIATIRGYVKSGYTGGTWVGNGIVSTTAGSNPNYGVGYSDGKDGLVAGLTSGQIEVAYALLGDIKLTGVVNALDFGILAGNFGKSVTGGWEQGDLNYDGVVNAIDFGDLAGNFGKSATGTALALPAADWAALDSFAAAHGLLADVPEPASGSLLLIAGAGLFVRRRRCGVRI